MKLLILITSISYMSYVLSIACYWNSCSPYNYFGSKTPYSMNRGDIRDYLVNFADARKNKMRTIMLRDYNIQTKNLLELYGCPYKFFGSKTPYNLVRGDIRDSLVKLTGCEPISVWGLMRHGKRNPSSEAGKRIKEALIIRDYIVSAYNSGNSSLCAQDIENLRIWSANEELFNKINQLAEEGYEESVQIGRRLKQAFGKLLANLDKEHYTFRSVAHEWAIKSLKGFIEGLGNKHWIINPSKDGLDNLSPFEKCSSYEEDFEGKNGMYSEVERYENHSEFLVLIDRIQRRLGINHPITKETIVGIYDLCRLTSSGIQNKFSQWCGLLTTEDLKVLEYREDLGSFYSSGYGTSMNNLFGEIILADLLNSFQDAKKTGKKITAYFTNSTTLIMVYLALGLFKDSYLLTGTERKPNRKWRTSKFSIFSNNLIAVLNRCQKEQDEDYNVIFYLNEEPLRTVCKGGVCTWNEFEDKLSPFLNTNLTVCK